MYSRTTPGRNASPKLWSAVTRKVPTTASIWEAAARLASSAMRTTSVHRAA